MYNIKTLLAAASLAVATAAGIAGAGAAPWDRPGGHRLAARERVLDSLRLHHYRGVAAPIFVRGHYVVRSQDRFGHVVFVEVDPHSGAFIGEFRV
jgi:hypothetical protein